MFRFPSGLAALKSPQLFENFEHSILEDTCSSRAKKIETHSFRVSGQMLIITRQIYAFRCREMTDAVNLRTYTGWKICVNFTHLCERLPPTAMHYKDGGWCSSFSLHSESQSWQVIFNYHSSVPPCFNSLHSCKLYLPSSRNELLLSTRTLVWSGWSDSIWYQVCLKSQAEETLRSGYTSFKTRQWVLQEMEVGPSGSLRSDQPTMLDSRSTSRRLTMPVSPTHLRPVFMQE